MKAVGHSSPIVDVDEVGGADAEPGGRSGVDVVRVREATPGRRRRRRSRPGVSAELLANAALIATCAVLVVAPLAVGGVHRVPMFLLLVGCVAAVALTALALFLGRRTMRVGWVALLPLLFVLIPAWQSVPLPHALRARLDPAGTALLEDNPLIQGRSWPLSLDPPITRVQVGKAAAGLAIFLLAFHVASGQRRRHILPRVIGATGIAAVAIGLGHRLFGTDRIYGMFAMHRSLLTGPLVNNNHNAEFLEIAAFACLACSFQKSSALNRVGWLVGTLLCAAGAVGTLSRGAALALAAATLAFLVQRYRDKDTQATGRRFWAGALAVLGLVVAVAVALGAAQIIERFHRSEITNDVRLQLWKDSLRVLAAHPLGIGRGAFERVYPIYRTVRTSFPLRFSFVENEPLQLLIESGWVLYAGIVAGLGFLAWTMLRHGRRDAIEGAMAAGVLAVIAHSFLDFGLEALGVLLPFMAMLGLVLGRSGAKDQALVPRRAAWPVVGLALAAMLFGAASVAHASNDDFDRLLQATTSLPQRRALLERAERAHPVDYFYVQAFARTEPLRLTAGGVSPRLHALNRALRLCPGCETVHIEVARSLWQLNLRSQSLVEWRDAVRLQPSAFDGALRELFAAGAKPEQLAAIAAFDASRMIDVANFMLRVGRLDDALVVLEQADGLGAPRVESLLTRGHLQMLAGRAEAARATLAEAHAAGIQDPRLVVLDAQAALNGAGAAGVDQALSILEVGATRYPQDLDIQRMRVRIVMENGKWQGAARAIDGLKMALYTAYGAAGEAHVAAARIQSRLSHWTDALGEYRIALADNPGDVALWMEFGRAAEQSGRQATAREAFAEAARLSPTNQDVQRELRRIDERQIELRRAQELGRALEVTTP
jgi:tetratricopeptide (TPR) repeat protein